MVDAFRSCNAPEAGLVYLDARPGASEKAFKVIPALLRFVEGLRIEGRKKRSVLGIEGEHAFHVPVVDEVAP